MQIHPSWLYAKTSSYISRVMRPNLIKMHALDGPQTFSPISPEPLEILEAIHIHVCNGQRAVMQMISKHRVYGSLVAFSAAIKAISGQRYDTKPSWQHEYLHSLWVVRYVLHCNRSLHEFKAVEHLSPQDKISLAFLTTVQFQVTAQIMFSVLAILGPYELLSSGYSQS